jgi:hypothetical protein
MTVRGEYTLLFPDGEVPNTSENYSYEGSVGIAREVLNLIGDYVAARG